MTPAALLAGVVSSALAAATTTYEVDVRSEVRAASDTSAAGVDGAEEIDPSATATVLLDHVSFTAAYDPRIYWIEPQPSAMPNVLHRGRLRLEDRFSGPDVLYLQEDASYGVNYFSPLAGSGGATVLPPTQLPSLPPTLLAKYVSSITQLGAQYELSHLWHLNMTGQYNVSGGPDLATQESGIPLMRSPRVDLNLAYAASRLDTFTTSATAFYASFTNGNVATLAQVTEAWHAQLGRTVDGEVSAGAAGAQNQPSIGTGYSALYPVAGVGLNVKTDAPGVPAVAHLIVGVAPYLDVFQAYIFERAEADLSLGLDYQHWLMSATVRGTMLLTGFDQRGDSLVVAEVDATHLLTPDVKLELGIRAYWAQGPNVIGGPVQAGLFAALTGIQKGNFGE
jgi:hypothetical protein